MTKGVGSNISWDGSKIHKYKPIKTMLIINPNIELLKWWKQGLWQISQLSNRSKLCSFFQMRWEQTVKHVYLCWFLWDFFVDTSHCGWSSVMLSLWQFIWKHYNIGIYTSHLYCWGSSRYRSCNVDCKHVLCVCVQQHQDLQLTSFLFQCQMQLSP